MSLKDSIERQEALIRGEKPVLVVGDVDLSIMHPHAHANICQVFSRDVALDLITSVSSWDLPYIPKEGS